MHNYLVEGNFFGWLVLVRDCSVLGSCRNSSNFTRKSSAKNQRAMITFSVCIFLLSSSPQLLRSPSGNSHCPGLQSKVRAWAGKEGQQSWDGGRKTGWCLLRWDYINSGVNEKPKSSTHYLATAQLKAATTNPRVWDTHETMGDLQRHRVALENSNDPPAGLVWGCPSAEQLGM